jgi:preprotein translocase subunit SecD
MAPRSRSGSRPWLSLTALAMIIVVMLLSITGGNTLHPGKWPEQFQIALGLDLSGGTELVLQAQTPAGHPPSAAEMNQASSILLSRVNSTGTTGGQVQQQGGNLLNVSVPKASSQVTDLVSGTAQMRFRQVLLWEPVAGSGHPSSPTAYYGDAGLVNAATMKLFNELKCAPGSNGSASDAWKATVGYTPLQDQWDNAGSQVVSCDANGGKYALDKAVFKGTDVTSANAGLLPNSSQWGVNLTLDGPATQAFGALATNQYDHYYPNVRVSENDAVLDQTAMTLDGDVVSAPQTADAITSGQFLVSGPSSAPFTQAQADQLADQLKYGALPLSFKLLEVNAITGQIAHASLVGGLSCLCPASPAWWWRSASRRTRSSCSSNGCGTRCGSAGRSARR